MIKAKKIFTNLISLTVLVSVVAFPSCKAKEKNVKLETKVVDAYILGETGLTKCGETRYYSVNDLVIPYKNISDFVNQYLTFDPAYGLASFKVETKNGISTITNLSSNGTAIINYKKQTITYPDLTAYFNETNRSDVPVGCDFGGDQYFIGQVKSERSTPQECVISLADYNQHVYLVNGKGYIPETFMVQALVPMALYGTVFNGKECFVVDGLPGTTEQFEQGVKYIRDTATIFNKEYMQYNYDILAFMFDFRFGLTGQVHVNRNPNAYEESHTFFKDGAYATLAKYKDNLCSTDLDVANATLATITQDELCDGGHSFYGCSDVFSTLEGSGLTFLMYMLSMCGAHEDPEMYENYYLSFGVGSKLIEARENTKADPKIMTDKEEAKAGFQIYPSEAEPSKKVAYMVFDEFISPEETEREGADRPTNIDENNYYDNTISLVYWADKQLKANPDVKDIVIDLSCNGGGNAYAEQFIGSWLCGGTSKFKLYNRQDKTLRTLVRHADVNLDGKFNQSDYLSNDYNVYCLFSNGSFSCGNLLPCDLKDHAVPTLHLLGTKTGGGSCSVESNHFNALGGNLTLSSLYTLCREESTPTNVITVEDGVEADFTKYTFAVGDELEYPEKFFAVDNIINAIVS